MDQHGFVIPAVEIKDQPRFPWRGILIDVCRHWQPKEVILRNIDGLAAVKMNVIHLHLSEDQGFRVESKRFPKLHELGADGKYFTQDDIREIIAYARDRGIRVVPEFDMPAHATSWFVGYPEFASAPGPYEIERKWGVFDPCFDPTREEVYQFLDEFIGEMAKLFPDQYFHIGGDEVTNKHWEENESIQSFMKEHNLTDYRHLQAHFSTRVAKIVASHGKTMAGWDEILHPDIPKGSLVQSWRGHNSLVEAARNDLQTILSHGFYLDHIKPASYHYNNEPLPLGVNIEGEDRTRVLGGEACMWAEYVSPETIDSRIWPRAGAVAERLWSPRDTNNVTDMYRRLSLLSDQLDRIGLLHEANRRRMLKRLTAGGSTESLEVLADVVHEVQMYGRQKKKYTSATPLNRLTDAVRPESKTARDFEQVVDHMLTSGELENQRDVLALWSYLQMWKGNHARLLPIIQASPLLHEIEPVSRNLARAAEIGLEAIKHWQEGTTANAEWVAEQKLFLEQAAQPTAELELAVIPAVTKLVDAAALETVNIASEK
jgi:hexosaminidase